MRLLLKVLHGKKHWLYHRFSAILFFPLVLWMAYSLSLVPEITHENMMLWVGRTQNYVLLSILIMISARHFQLGIQVILEDYSLLNLYADYKLQNDYKLNFSLKNLLDENYNEALNYSTPGRSMNLKLRKQF